MGSGSLTNKSKGPRLWRLVGATLMEWMDAALEELQQRQNLLDQWNVFPVADGDTGHNMVATLAGAVFAMRQGSSEALPDVLARIADGALNTARGNSGLILSQLFAGFAEVAQNKPAFEAVDLKRALRRGAERAREHVVNPVEGTMLTVADAIADAALSEGDLQQCLTAIVRAGDEALKRTTQQLPQLAHSDMVDAGGLGYVSILRGWLNVVEGRNEGHFLPTRHVVSTVVAENSFQSGTVSNYYDVQALLYHLRGEDLVGRLAERLATVGDSIVIAPGNQVLNVHVHTEHPVELMEILVDVGDIRQMEWLDMRHQVASRPELPRLRIVAERVVHPLFESEYDVVEFDLGADQPDTLWIKPPGALSVAIGVSSIGLAGQAALEYVPGEDWSRNRARLLTHLQTMKQWVIERTPSGFMMGDRVFESAESLQGAIQKSLGEYGLVTIYLSQTARREEAVFWQEALNAELVQVPREVPWMEIVWQP